MRIKELREKRGLYQEHIASACGVSTVAVSKWERGAAYPSADKLPLLAEALHCSIDALYVREPSQAPPAEAN